LGSLLLATAVIGSGIMAERLAAGSPAVALLANTAATMAALAVLISVFAPVSGAHFNPAVTIVAALRRTLQPIEAAGYVSVQILGCCAGALLAHAMFGLELIQHSGRMRSGPGQWTGEVLATAGLILVVLASRRPRDAAWRVAAWIGSAYWFTSSTSFANPAITIARSLSDTFTGIRPADVPPFMLAQLLGAAAGMALWLRLFAARRPAAGRAGPEAR
jgi:glycerol uptake facilitator-like aquaporin